MEKHTCYVLLAVMYEKQNIAQDKPTWRLYIYCLTPKGNKYVISL